MQALTGRWRGHASSASGEEEMQRNRPRWFAAGPGGCYYAHHDLASRCGGEGR